MIFSQDITSSSPEESYYSKQEDEIKPFCVVHPASTTDVSIILKTLKGYNVPFAIRCGGHAVNKGAANIDDGITINLRKINDVRLHPQLSLVSVAGGCKWHDVYSALVFQGLATSGGRLSDVGVGGLSTGG